MTELLAESTHCLSPTPEERPSARIVLNEHIHVYQWHVNTTSTANNVSSCLTLQARQSKANYQANLFDWREFLLALHGERPQVCLHILQQFLHRLGTAGRHL